MLLTPSDAEVRRYLRPPRGADATEDVERKGPTLLAVHGRQRRRCGFAGLWPQDNLFVADINKTFIGQLVVRREDRFERLQFTRRRRLYSIFLARRKAQRIGL